MSKIRDESNDVKSSKPAVAAVRDARALSFEDFRLPADGRKWKAVAKIRRALYMELSTYSNGDGTGACPSIESLQRVCGSERTTFRRLDELKKLGLIRDEGKSRFQGTMSRTVLLPNTEDPEMTVTALRQLRDRRKQQQRDGQLLPNGYEAWEAMHRRQYPELWEMLDQDAPMVPDSPNVSILPDSPASKQETASIQEDASIVPDSHSDSPILPDRASMLPNSTPKLPDRGPMLPRMLAHDRPSYRPSDRPFRPNATSQQVTVSQDEPKPTSEATALGSETENANQQPTQDPEQSCPTCGGRLHTWIAHTCPVHPDRRHGVR